MGHFTFSFFSLCSKALDLATGMIAQVSTGGPSAIFLQNPFDEQVDKGYQFQQVSSQLRICCDLLEILLNESKLFCLVDAIVEGLTDFYLTSQTIAKQLLENTQLPLFGFFNNESSLCGALTKKRFQKRFIFFQFFSKSKDVEPSGHCPQLSLSCASQVVYIGGYIASSRFLTSPSM